MTEQLKKKFLPIKDELYQLLLAAYCYKRKVSYLEKRLRSESRAFLLEEMTALRLMSNEIVLQLCKLDDDDGKWTLRSLKKEVLKHIKDQARVDKANRLSKEYRAKLNTFKTKHRNAYIAHRNVEEYPDLFALLGSQDDFRSPIRAALELFEMLWEAPVSFNFTLGSKEPLLDFKKELCLV